jgi:hypothetical protein
MTLDTALKNSCRVTAEPGIPMPVAGKEIRQSSVKKPVLRLNNPTFNECHD